MRIAFVIAILGLSACTTVQAPPEPVVVTAPRPATTVVVPAKPVAVVPAGERPRSRAVTGLVTLGLLLLGSIG